MKNKLLKIIPVLSVIIFYSLSTLGKNDLKASDITIEQLEAKHIASQEVLKKVAQHEIETSWINASIVSIEKDNLDSKWLIIFKNEENTQKDKKLNISINSNGDIIESKLI
jgi:hypothetical protein